MSKEEVKVSSVEEDRLRKKLETLLVKNNITAVSDEFHELLKKAIDLKSNHPIIQKRVSEIQDVLVSMMQLDFSRRIIVKNNPDLIDFFANGLNSLNEELQDKVISKESATGDNEKLTKNQLKLLQESKAIMEYYEFWELYAVEAQNSNLLTNHFNYLSCFAESESLDHVANEMNVSPLTAVNNINKAHRVLWKNPTVQNK